MSFIPSDALTSRQIGRMFFNQTIEQLEAGKCATEGTFSALNSTAMMISHYFVLSIILVSFALSVSAFRMLWKQHVFSDCARIILWSGLMNGAIHQVAMGTIRIKSLYNVYFFGNNSCAIQSHTSDCFYQLWVYYVTNIFASVFLVSLFLDRFLSLRVCSYSEAVCQRRFAYLFVILQCVISFLVVFDVFRDVPFIGYVPMCSYPPQPALIKFYSYLGYRLVALLLILVGSCFILWFNMKKEKKMVHNVYDVTSRYKSYENVLTTTAVCHVIFAQFMCLASTSIMTNVIHEMESKIPESIFHTLLAFMGGTTYSNLILPIVLYWKTSNIIKYRRTTIKKNRVDSKHNEEFHAYFEALDVEWGTVPETSPPSHI